MKSNVAIVAVLCGFFTFGALQAVEKTKTINPEADRLLKQAGEKLAKSKAFSFKAEIWEDSVVSGHKVTTEKTIVAQVRHPDRLHIEVQSPSRTRGYWYDGKTVTMLDRVKNFYGVIAVPDSIDKVIDEANDKYDINFPLEDLLVNDPYQSAMEQIKGAAYFGKVTVLGTPCHHLGFSTDQVDMQLWVEDATSLPKKLSITYKKEDTQPQYTAIFTEWKMNETFPDKTFVFMPPPGAAKVDVKPGAREEEQPVSQ